MMSFDRVDCEEMKENVDINVLHKNQSNKQHNSKSGKTTKRQLFKDNAQQIKNIKKTAYIVDTDSEQEQSYIQIGESCKKQIKPYRSIDQVSEIIESLSRQVSFPTSPKNVFQAVSICQSHSLPVLTYNFCLECSSYLLCQTCIKSHHSKHMILSFQSEPETKKMTKKFLIEKIEETLQKLKSKQNDLKNKTCEMEIILKNTKRMEGQIIEKLERTFLEIQQTIRRVYEKQAKHFEESIDDFYHQYNHTGDQLRENLLSIIEDSFSIKQFNVSMISKQPPEVPNQQIDKFKSALQKTKRFYKSIGQSLDEIREKSQKISNFNQTNKRQTTMRDRKASIKKYEKFLTDSCYANDKDKQNKSSLIRILDTLTS